MICPKCGYQCNEGEAFCNNCGNSLQPVNNGYANYNASGNYSNANNTYGNVQNSYNSASNSNQGYNNVNYSQAKSSQGIPTGVAVIVFLVMLLIIAVMGFMMVSGGNKDSDKKTSKSNDKIEAVDEKEDEEEEIEKEEKVVVTKKNQKVAFGDFQVSVPRQYLHEVLGEQLALYNEDETWVSVFEIQNAKYSDMLKNKVALKPYLEQQGGKVESVDIKTIAGKEMIVAEFEMTGQKYSGVYTKADANNTLCITVMSTDGTYGQDVLEEIGSVIASIEPASDSGYAAKVQLDQEKLIKEVIK